MVHQKRLPAPKHYPIERKQNTYISTIEGSRSSENAIPAVLFLRDVVEYADTETEAKEIVRKGQLLRNGDRIRDIREGIGVLDVVELPEAEESYRAIRRGKYLEFKQVENTDKVAKIVDRTEEGQRSVYRLHTGENYSTKDEFCTGNTLVFGDGVEEVEMAEGNQVLVIDGKHAGETAELVEVREGGMNPDTGVVENDHEFETRLENLVAVEGVEVGE